MPRDIVTIRRRGGYFTPVPTGFVPCAGTAIHVVAPNNLTDASWTASNITPTFGVTDPLSGTTATSLVAGNNTAFGELMATTLGALAGSTTYAFGAYFKSVVLPSWIIVQVTDGSGNTIGAFFNVANPGFTVGTTIGNGTGVLTCSNIAASTNGFVRLSFAGNFGAGGLATSQLQIYLVDANSGGTGSATIGQRVDAWQVSP
jgi:hypothetical protein